MTTKAETMIHPKTGEELRRGERKLVVRVKGRRRVVLAPGWYPADPNDSDYFQDAQDRAMTLQFAREAGHTLTLLTGPQIRQAREMIGLSQREASWRLGGGHRAFTKYENGSVGPSVAMCHLLRMLARHPRRLRELDLPWPPQDKPKKRKN